MLKSTWDSTQEAECCHLQVAMKLVVEVCFPFTSHHANLQSLPFLHLFHWKRLLLSLQGSFSADHGWRGWCCCYTVKVICLFLIRKLHQKSNLDRMPMLRSKALRRYAQAWCVFLERLLFSTEPCFARHRASSELGCFQAMHEKEVTAWWSPVYFTEEVTVSSEWVREIV